MTDARWYFDFISPFSYLQLHHVLAWRDRLDITPVPIAFGAVLQHHGQLGPAEIPGKREFTYRFVLFEAEREGIALKFPPAHPFNPLSALRLCIAAGTTWQSIETIFDHIWRDGRAATTAADLKSVADDLGIGDPEAAIQAENVKSRLRENTEKALAEGVFGVPTLRTSTELFWGNDATPMIQAWVAEPALFTSAEYQRISQLPAGIQRRR